MDTLNLLTEPLLTIRSHDGSLTEASLPEVLIRLNSNEIGSFTNLMAHQQHALYAFLVQIAAMAVHLRGGDMPDDIAEWTDALRALSNGEDGPWCLVRSDIAAAAFLQPPSVGKSISDYKNVMETPDQMDLLITSKNHDVKAARMSMPRTEQWLFALLSLQTMQGFSGRGNYGITRMNGGFGNRPVVSRISSMNWGVRWKRDVRLLLEGREDIVDRRGYAEVGGIKLVWLQPWSGGDSLTFGDLDPWFVEVCRLVRLEQINGKLQARMMATTAPRIRGHSVTGHTGDPWTPLKLSTKDDDLAALTIGGSGINYKLLHDLLLSESYQAPLCMKQDTSPLLWVATLVRGQGTTEGYHERLLPIPPRIDMMFFDPHQKQTLSKRSKARIENVEAARNKALRMALKGLLNAGEPGSRNDDRPDRWIAQFEKEVDREFFPSLWRSADQTVEEAQKEWWEFLQKTATLILEQAIAEVPLPSVRRYRAIASATGILHGSFFNLRKQETQ